jgi:hypothetical protein
MADSARPFVIRDRLEVRGDLRVDGNITSVGFDAENIDATLLEGQAGSYYTNADNLITGTVSNNRLPTTITKNLSGNVTGSVDATNGNVIADSATFGSFRGEYLGYDSDFDSAFSEKTTDALGEGTTNLYYTTNRFDSDLIVANNNNPAFGGTGSPFTVTSTTQVNNLNAQYLGGNEASGYLQSQADDNMEANLTFLDGNILRFGTGADQIVLSIKLVLAI